MDDESPPRLAAPGAGLPPFELMVGRAAFAVGRLVLPRVWLRKRFERERDTILALVARCPLASRGRRVLVPRGRGMEDSSRFWSVWMTLDHLRITNEAFSMVVGELAAGSAPARKASIAEVKPDPAAGEEAESAFRESCGRYLRIEAAVPDLRTPLRYEHPWFGPLDAAGWHALAGGHMGIHRRQLANILRALGV